MNLRCHAGLLVPGLTYVTCALSGRRAHAACGSNVQKLTRHHSLAVWQLWNLLMPKIFGLPALSFWQAVGLLSLSWILFGSWRGFPRPHGHWRRGMRERWAQMSPEERESFRKGMESRCGPRVNATGADSPNA